MFYSRMPNYIFGGTEITGDEIPYSCYFDSSTLDFLVAADPTWPDGGTDTTWSVHCWIKRESLGANNTIFSSRAGDDNITYFLFNSNNKLWFRNIVSSTTRAQFITTATYTDTDNWMAIHLVYDSTQAVEGDRFSLSVNGTKITAYDTAVYPTLDRESRMFQTSCVLRLNHLGVNYSGATQYMADFIALDNIVTTPSDFGRSLNGKWVPKTYAGAYSGLSVHYDFAAALDLGNDVSGNGFDLTESGDPTQSTDTPPIS